MAETSRVAVLIDCENVPAARARDVLAETARHGTLSIKRAYGDFTSPYLAGWHRLLPELAIQPVQGFPFTSAGKNGSDAALIVDAMDLLYATATDVFCIVSSDSDFTRLATRLRESGKRVYGIGARNAAVAFRNACDRYTYLDLLQPAVAVEDDDASTPADAVEAASAPVPVEAAARVVPVVAPVSAVAPVVRTRAQREELVGLVRAAVAATAQDDGWVTLARVGWYIVNTHPTFDSRGYGYPKLGPLVRDQAGIEVETRTDAGGNGQTWVRLETPTPPVSP